MDKRDIARRLDRIRDDCAAIKSELLSDEPAAPTPHRFVESQRGSLCAVCILPPSDRIHQGAAQPEPPPSTTSAVFTLDDMRPVDLTPERPWSTTGGWLHVRAWFEPRGVTVYACNGYPGQGRRTIGRLRVTVGRDTVLLVENKPLPPRYAYIASTIPVGAEAWQDVPESRFFPAWSEPKALEEIAGHNQRVLDHPVWWPDRNHGAPAGHGVAPGFGGEWEWLCGPAGKALRWQMVLGELWTNVHAVAPETGEPLRVCAPWWTGNEAANQLKGYEWTPQNDAERELWNKGRMHDGYHRRRAYGQCAALAHCSEPARFLLRMIWNDTAMEWSMDPAREPDGNALLMPLWQRIEESAPGKRFAVPANCPWGNRGFAHAINTLCEVWPYIPEREARDYATGFASLAANIHDIHGICGRDNSGDAAQWAHPPFNMKPPFAMTFHDQLVGDALSRLSRVSGLTSPGEIATKKKRFLTVKVPPYGFESTPTTNARETVWDRKNTAAQGSYAFSGYGVFINGTWIDSNGWRSFEEMDAAAQNESLTGLPRYECVPPSLRPRS